MNPASRGGRSQGCFERIHKLFGNIDYDFEYTENMDHATELSRRANEKGYDVVVAIGGDGTINRVLNGFYDNRSCCDMGKSCRAKFGVIHTGTSPDFCKHYGIPLDIDSAVDVLKKGESRKIGVGRVEFGDRVRYFACCLNVGLGAELANNANSGIRRKVGDKLGTFLSLLKTLKTYKPIDIMVNGEKLTNLYNLSVGKTYYVASGLKIKNDLHDGDDRFYLCTAQGFTMKHIWKMYTGMDLGVSYAEKIKIEGEGMFDLDGDAEGSLPCTVSPAEKLELISTLTGKEGDA